MARYASPLNNGTSGVEGETRLLGKLLSGSGVLSSTDLLVSAQTTPDMTVKVAAGDAAVFSGAILYHGWSTANETVTINGNTSGSSKTDAILAYIDPAAASATENNPNGMVLVAVRGASGAPTNTEVNTAIGSKPYLVLATVVVGNGVTSINSGNITDGRTIVRIAPAAITNLLGSASITSNFSTSSTSSIQVTGLSASVTIPAGGRPVRISVFADSTYATVSSFMAVEIWDGAVGSGTRLAHMTNQSTASGQQMVVYCQAVVTPAAGAKTYNVAILTSAGTMFLLAGSNLPAVLVAEML